VHAGNVYVNRNIVGAVVGVQPFGGHGLSGTGPKAGGPLYLRRLVRGAVHAAPAGPIVLPGPTGETNTLEFRPRRVVACIASIERALLAQAWTVLAAGGTPMLLRGPEELRARESLGSVRVLLADRLDPGAVDAVLLDVMPDEARRIRAELAASPGPIVPILVPRDDGTYDEARLLIERTVTVNTSAAGGNAALLSLAEDGAAGKATSAVR
jgi:RHH-type proline utilization regulon transcriptional repressor/proline dehydrogenase/delta 1-pyrroline-5-carboxylate dehydrogenase